MSMCKIDKFYKISKFFVSKAVHMGTFPEETLFFSYI